MENAMATAIGTRPLWPWNAATMSGMAAIATQAQTRVPKGIKVCSGTRNPTGQHENDAVNGGDGADREENSLHRLAPRAGKEVR